MVSNSIPVTLPRDFLPTSQLARNGRWREDEGGKPVNIEHSTSNAQHRTGKRKARREQFADGSAVVTYPDGSMLILESGLAREAVFMEARPVHYNDPPPPPAGEAKKREREKYSQMLKARPPGIWRQLPPMVSVPSIKRPK